MKWSFAVLAFVLIVVGCAKQGNTAATSSPSVTVSPTVTVAPQPSDTYTPTKSEIEAEQHRLARLSSDPDSVISKQYTEEGCDDAFGYTIGTLGRNAQQSLSRQEYSKARHLAKASLKGLDLCSASFSPGPQAAQEHVWYATLLYVVAKSYIEQGDIMDGSVQAGEADSEADSVARDPDNSASDRMAARQLIIKIKNLAPN
jgi:hypothetical protein